MAQGHKRAAVNAIGSRFDAHPRNVFKIRGKMGNESVIMGISLVLTLGSQGCGIHYGN